MSIKQNTPHSQPLSIYLFIYLYIYICIHMIVIYSNYSNTWIIQVGCHQDSRQTPGAATGEVGHAGQRRWRRGRRSYWDGKSTKKHGKIQENHGIWWTLGDGWFEFMVILGNLVCPKVCFEVMNKVTCSSYSGLKIMGISKLCGSFESLTANCFEFRC